MHDDALASLCACVVSGATRKAFFTDKKGFLMSCLIVGVKCCLVVTLTNDLDGKPFYIIEVNKGLGASCC